MKDLKDLTIHDVQPIGDEYTQHVSFRLGGERLREG